MQLLLLALFIATAYCLSPLVTVNEFNDAVSICYSYRPSSNLYTSAIKSMDKLGGINTKREFAMFLANAMWESDGLRAKSEYACQNNGCAGMYQTNSFQNGKQYYGRGFMQLTWSYNYELASRELYGDLRLIEYPEQVESDDGIAWETALWFWNKYVHAQVQNGEFGKSVKVINGGYECSGSFQDKARKRFELYKKVLIAFGVNEIPIENGCYN